LSDSEAEYILERIRTRARDSLLAFLIAREVPTAVAAPWLHPELGLAPGEIRRQVEMGRIFSEVMHGAALLYNLMLAQKRGDRELVDDYDRRLAAWSSLDSVRRPPPDWHEFWSVALVGNPRITPATRRFVQAWFDVAAKLGDEVAADEHARSLVERRERQTKKSQARLANARRLETWNGATALRQLSYRWEVVQTIINDVLEGVGKGIHARG
jgi:hypothetical protein